MLTVIRIENQLDHFGSGIEKGQWGSDKTSNQVARISYSLSNALLLSSPIQFMDMNLRNFRDSEEQSILCRCPHMGTQTVRHNLAAAEQQLFLTSEDV